MEKLKVLIAEDHAITSKLLARMLSSSGKIEIVGVVSDGASVLQAIPETKPDLILLDISLPFVDGLQVMESLKNQNHDMKILVLSGHSEAWIIRKSMDLGAAGYLSKSVSITEVIDAILTISNGDLYFDKTSMDSILKFESAEQVEVSSLISSN